MYARHVSAPTRYGLKRGSPSPGTSRDGRHTPFAQRRPRRQSSLVAHVAFSITSGEAEHVPEMQTVPSRQLRVSLHAAPTDLFGTHWSMAHVLASPLHDASEVHGIVGLIDSAKTPAHANVTVPGASSAGVADPHHGASTALHAVMRCLMISTHSATSSAPGVLSGGKAASITTATTCLQRATSIGGCPAPTQQLENALQ